MIIKESKITIKNQTATIDEDIYLFKNDRNIELRFQIAKLSYAFTNDDNDNLILGTNASHFLIKMKKDELEYNFGIQRTEEGKARLLITHELIDEDVELGDYDLQIRLYDADKCAVLTLPPLEKCLHILPPLFEDDDLPKADESLVGFSETTEDGEIINAFDENGNYIRTVWQSGDLISVARLNKIEEGLENAVYVLDDYVTKDELDIAINGVDVTEQLGEYAKKSEIPTNVSQLTNDSGYLSAIPSEYVTDEELNAKGYLTQHQDLSAYAKKTDIPSVPTKVSELTNDKNYISSIPSEYVTDTELTNKGYATETYVSNAIANAQLGGDNTEIDLSGYATKDDLKAKADEKHTHEEYATEKYVDDSMANIPTYDDTEVRGLIENINDLPLLSSICMKNEDGSFVQISGVRPIDFELVPKDKTVTYFDDITNTSILNNAYLGLYKDGELTNVTLRISSIFPIVTIGYRTSNQQLVFGNTYNTIVYNLADGTKSTNDSYSLSAKANSSNVLSKTNNTEFIPTGDYHPATKKYVDDSIANAQLGGEEVDLSGYAKTSDIPTATSQLTNDSNFLTSIPSEYVTDTELNAKGYLTQHQSLEGYATEDYVDDALTDALGGERTIFSGGTGDVLSDSYTDFSDFMCWVADVSIEINSDGNPYSVTIDGVTYEGSDSSYDVENNAWYWDVDGTWLYIHNDYDGQNKLCVTWDGFYYDQLTVTKSEKIYATVDYVDKTIEAMQGDNDIVIIENVNNTVTMNGERYQVADVLDGTTINLPIVNSFTEIHLFFTADSDMTLTLPSCKWQNTPSFTTGKVYELIFTYVNASIGWVGGCISYGD